jgi:hypothetical protein
MIGTTPFEEVDEADFANSFDWQDCRRSKARFLAIGKGSGLKSHEKKPGTDASVNDAPNSRESANAACEGTWYKPKRNTSAPSRIPHPAIDIGIATTRAATNAIICEINCWDRTGKRTISTC